MSRDFTAAQQILALILTDVQARRAWEQDARAFARGLLRGSAEIDMIASLSPAGIAAAALHLDLKRLERATAASPISPSEGEPQQTAQMFHSYEQMGTPKEILRSSLPLVGVGHWPDLFEALGSPGSVDVWEHRIDDYLAPSGVTKAKALFQKSAVVLHSVNLSLGSPEATSDSATLVLLRSILRAARVQALSDHLAFSRVAGRSLEHFEPIWRIDEAATLIAHNIERLQDGLGIRLALENIAPTFDPGGDMSPMEFLNEMVRRTGCGILLDITNLTLSEKNGFCDAKAELSILNRKAVIGVHLAGGDMVDGLAYDAHAFPLADEDLAWLKRLLPDLTNCRSIILERDGRREELTEIMKDLQRVRAVLRSVDVLP